MVQIVAIPAPKVSERRKKKRFKREGGTPIIREKKERAKIKIGE